MSINVIAFMAGWRIICSDCLLFLFFMFRSDFFRRIHWRSWKGPVAHEPTTIGHWPLWVVHRAARQETLTSFYLGGGALLYFATCGKKEKKHGWKSCIGRLWNFYNIILLYRVQTINYEIYPIKETKRKKCSFVILFFCDVFVIKSWLMYHSWLIVLYLWNLQDFI